MGALKTKYKYIEFVQESNMYQANPIWRCKNKRHGSQLGIVEYYPEWKQWVIGAIDHRNIFSADCLDDISHFLKQLNSGV